jgi:hypothetical protein
MKTEVVTAETLEQFKRSHGAVRIGDTVQIRENDVYVPYRIYPETVRTLEYIARLKTSA